MVRKKLMLTDWLPKPEPLTMHQRVMLGLSVYVVAALLMRELMRLSPLEITLLNGIDTGICGYFLYDFGLRFRHAPDKLTFLRWNGIDLLASIPVFAGGGSQQWRHIIRILRMIRVFPVFQTLAIRRYRNRANNIMTIVLLSAGLLFMLGAVALLYVEQVPGGNIKTPSDALWCSFVTITTVGYGDRFPVTTAGRLVAIVLMLAGVVLIGTISGFLSNFFVEQEQKAEDNDIRVLIDEVRHLRTKIEALEHQSNRQ